MSSCDWISTKKRGKDDKQIARDSRQALEKKKQERNKKNQKTVKKKGSAGAGVVGARNTVKSRRRKENSYDDDDYSEEGFIVHDDDEEDFIEESEGSFDSGIDDDDSDDDDDVVLHDDDDSDDSVAEVIDITTSSRNSRASLSIASSSSDSERESFLPPGVARHSTPSKLLKKNSNAANRRFNASLEASSSMNADKKKRKKSVDSLMQLKPPALKKSKRPIALGDKCESNEDDEELISPCSNGNNRFNSKDNINFEEVFSSDEESNKNVITSNNPRATGTDGRKYVQQKTQETFVLDVEDSDDEETNIQQMQAQCKNEINHSLEDTPEPTNKKRRRLKKKGTKMNAKKSKGKIRATSKESSDEDEMSIVDNGGFNEEDIDVAMRESIKDNNKKKTNYETILHESSSDDEEEDQGDEYIDHEKETATSVLRNAERLSSYVVRAMSGWFNNDKDSSSNNPVQGIIMDGAVSLGNLDGGEVGSDDSDHKWISNSEMCEACPNVTLSKYQLIGVNWLALLNGMSVNGVLADEMGLGKTVQTIAFLAWLKYRRQSKVIDVDTDSKSEVDVSLPHLIVVPVSTLPNWIREFEKFCPEMKVIKYHGSQQERENMKDNLRGYLPNNRKARPQNELDVIVAPVSYFQKENSPDRKFLSSFKYDYLIVDEAHNLKNAKSTRYKMLDKVKTVHRLLLTGTPVQNNPQELLNMLSFIMPLFSSAGAAFDEQDNYIEQMLKHFVDDKVEDGDEQVAYRKLKQLFAPFVLRRKKEDVIAQLLPKKERKTIFVKLTDGTRAIYQSIISAHLNKNSKEMNPALGEHLFTNLRKCAHHPLLLRNRWNSEIEMKHLTDCFYKYGAFKGEGCTKQRVGEEIASWNDFNIHLTALDLIQENNRSSLDLDRYVLKEEDLFCSAKFESLRKLLPDLISNNHRILIFSSWTSCLDLLGCLMDYLKLKYQRMDGSFHSDDRQRLIDQFNNDRNYSVFLLSTKACGLGINLTSADTCIIHDLDFNPFNDLQAEDRCHRIGQKLSVTVYKLVTSDTVDEDIYKMQEKKSKMNAAIMDSSTSRKEKKNILKSVLTKARCDVDSDCEII
mmetsp:Transcript_27842/g.31267  ORF Transcript_27842/g.31267 Transcript_27842/m.31267 type:complete len:1081 (-) Transcript_27842:1872-5114(-)|eukprot:CAMPEP_0170778878 /NCGR_PEP_ID=MMETSP0733-20121128/12650_1 /TAXON_ID=186038 /ORGANISM="Fragilariopsis kerguelensis, Strain L26-C5" /LENGTH=1080 /DNA_ID=CAMNT_0011122379 /DNA_START=33 /DNA_END=3275 /DNA_ORIENTATION=+